jgi:ech hydrogenase subunit D
MSELLKNIEVTPETLVTKATEMRDQGWRLVQICAAGINGQIELNYSFDRNFELVNFRMMLAPEGARVPSITSVYWCAFAYENELHDLFNVQVDGNAVDFGGKFYNTKVPFPFQCTTPPAADAQQAAAPTPAPAP